MRAGPITRLSIDGWKIRYYDPRLGTHEWMVTSHQELAKAKEWLNDGGYCYTIREVVRGRQPAHGRTR